MPSDITGTEILDEEEGTGRRRMRFVTGADLRQHHPRRRDQPHARPRPQAALLQAMQEYKVTGRRRRLSAGEAVPGARHAEPDRAGRHLSACPKPSSTASCSRSWLTTPASRRNWPSRRRRPRGELPTLEPLLDRDAILKIQKVVRKVLIGRSVTTYAVTLARATRPHSEEAPDFVKKYLSWGAGPAGLPGDAAGGEGKCAARRTCACLDGGYSLRGPARAAAPAGRQTSVRDSDGVTTDHIVEKLFRYDPRNRVRRPFFGVRRFIPPALVFHPQKKPKRRLKAPALQRAKRTMSNRYFDPDGLSRIGNMELVARQVVEGFLTGRHRSPYHGFSVEYLDHRAYTPGDEIRSIDWKILARTNKYFVKTIPG